MNNQKEIIEKNHYNRFVYIKTKKDTNIYSKVRIQRKIGM